MDDIKIPPQLSLVYSAPLEPGPDIAPGYAAYRRKMVDGLHGPGRFYKPYRSPFKADAFRIGDDQSWKSLSWLDDIPKKPGEGHVYLAEFPGNVIKVGKSRLPFKRLCSLLSNENRGTNFGLVWVTFPHVQWEQNEQKIIDYCSRFPLVRGRERFLVNDDERNVDLYEFVRSLKKTRALALGVDPTTLLATGDTEYIQACIDELARHNEFMESEHSLAQNTVWRL